MKETNLEKEKALEILNRAGQDLRVALVMQKADVDFQKAKNALEKSNFVIEEAIKIIQNS
jgi:N-acetylmuramic acid 6-phosphate (MurNAc-6-P) etherase